MSEPVAAIYRVGLPYRNPLRYDGRSAEPTSGLPSESASVAAPWGTAEGRARALRLPFEGRAPGQAAATARWSTFSPWSRAAQLPARSMPAHGELAGLPWGDIRGHHDVAVSAPFEAMDPRGQMYAVPWADFEGQHGESTAAAWTNLEPHGRATVLPWGQFAAWSLSRSVLWQRIVARGGFVALPWSPIAARSRSTVVVWPPTPPVDDDPILIPDLPVYVMLPTLTAVRLPDRTPIPILAASLQEELGGFVWSFTAPMSRQGLALVNPHGGAPPQIEITINGHVWTFLVDAYDDNRRFGSNTLTLRGRSLGALLAAPHAATRTYTEAADRSAGQLADAELPPGWSLVWDAVDWLVPGGTFSYADLAPIEAIAQIASSIGAAVQSHPANRELRVAPTYAASPWKWGEVSPYAIVPAAVISEGSSSWKGGSNPNGIYVYAQNAASGALVKITGTSGGKQAPMVVDPLLVTADAQRERGRHELASAGQVRTVQRTVPLFPTPAPAGMPDLGVVRPGKLLEIEDTDETWVGMVTAVRIDAQRSGQALSVRQHLTIERQYR